MEFIYEGNIRKINTVFEMKNYTMHYLTYLQKAIAGKIKEIPEYNIQKIFTLVYLQRL